MNDRERRIRDEAYRIWVEEGRPEGEGSRHWLEAEKRVGIADEAGAAAVKKTKAPKSEKTPKPGGKAAAGAVAADAGKAAAKGAKKSAAKQAEGLIKQKPSASKSDVEGANAAPAPGLAAGKAKIEKAAKAGAAKEPKAAKPVKPAKPPKAPGRKS